MGLLETFRSLSSTHGGLGSAWVSLLRTATGNSYSSNLGPAQGSPHLFSVSWVSLSFVSSCPLSYFIHFIWIFNCLIPKDKSDPYYFCLVRSEYQVNNFCPMYTTIFILCLIHFDAFFSHYLIPFWECGILRDFMNCPKTEIKNKWHL